MRKIVFLALFFGIQLSLSTPYEKDFFPHAGYLSGIVPQSVKVGSNAKDAPFIVDQKENSVWESEALLPTGFINKIQSNFLYKNENRVSNKSQFKGIEKAFDGNLDTAVDAPLKEIEIKLLPSQNTTCLYLKIGAKEKVSIFTKNNNGKELLVENISASESYKWLKINDLSAGSSFVLLRSDASFQLFELAASSSSFFERIYFDFGQKTKVKYLELKDNRTEGTVKNLVIHTSLSSDKREEVAFLQIKENWLELEEEKDLRYVLLEYEMENKDWQKLRISEVKAYDRNGKTGRRNQPRPSSISLKEMLGVNGYWSFGRNKYSRFVAEGDGVDMYIPFSSHLRNYHDMSWDLKDPDDVIDFDEMSAGKGTPAKEWLNWDIEYGDWIQHGINIQASLQFFRFPDKSWDNPYQSAYNYAFAFARHFGPTHGNGLICSMEIGNEPWKYDAAIYQKILLGMAKGAKAADPNMEVFPCALQAADPSVEDKDGFKNYIGARIPKEVLPYLDGINVHCYSYNSHDTGKQKALQPESQNSVFWEILNAIRWRDVNMPGKKIYLSEWGWDSDGGGEDCTHIQCVEEADAAAFAVRGALIAHRLGVDRASWFYYGNEEGESRLYARSGLTASKAKNFQKKLGFYAFQNMAEHLGDLYFLDVYKEKSEVWGYWYGDSKGNKTHLILWRPVMKDSSKISQSIRLNSRPNTVFELPLKGAKKLQNVNYVDGILKLDIGGMPTIIEWKE